MQPITLFCLPYAGGAAAVYRNWPLAAPGWLHIAPLHLPGRGLRHDQALLPDWAPLIDLLVVDVQVGVHAHPDRPFALFGHSLGALLAFELAHALRRRLGVEPCWVGVSGCPAPSHHVAEMDWLTCPEQDVLDELTAFGQTAPELLANREFVELIAPVVRNHAPVRAARSTARFMRSAAVATTSRKTLPRLTRGKAKAAAASNVRVSTAAISLSTVIERNSSALSLLHCAMCCHSRHELRCNPSANALGFARTAPRARYCITRPIHWNRFP
jgi:surfactin synthase thioesterase subunit